MISKFLKWLANYINRILPKDDDEMTLEDVVEKQTTLEHELEIVKKTLTDFSESMIMLPPDQAKRVRLLRNYKFYPKKPS